MNKQKRVQSGTFSPYYAPNRGTAKVFRPSESKKREAAAAANKTKRSASPVGKPRIARPQYDIDDVEVQGLFNPFGGGIGAPAGGLSPSGGNFLSLFKRIGGLDGILSTMSKVQKMYSIFQQMSPIFKLMGGFGGIGGMGGAQAKTASVKPRPKQKSVRLKPKR